jgi:bifunctional non-homologous end joining protein LigD
MKAVAGELPTGEGWAFEIKWDGMRILTFADHGAVQLRSANDKDVTVGFPELAALATDLADHAALLDGEVVAVDTEGRPDFGQLQQRMHVATEADALRLAAEVPIVYQVFDLLHLDGHDTTGLPYLDRRRLLEQLVDEGPHWRVPATHLGEGDELLEAARRQQLEGLVAKRVDSTYEPGKRSRLWRKVKIRNEQEFVVGGWAEGEGSRRGRVGGLLIGYFDDDELRYAGRVGSGLTEEEIERLSGELARRERDTCPFAPPPPRAFSRGARWVEPEIVVQVAFAEWTAEGRLRHPSYLGTRDDKDARAVTREP